MKTKVQVCATFFSIAKSLDLIGPSIGTIFDTTCSPEVRPDGVMISRAYGSLRQPAGTT